MLVIMMKKVVYILRPPLFIELKLKEGTQDVLVKMERIHVRKGRLLSIDRGASIAFR